MRKTLTNRLKTSLLFLLPATAMAQYQKPELPYNANLVRMQPETGVGNPSFRPSAEVRGMKALADDKVYLVSTGNQSIHAYQGSRLVWKSNVVNACPVIIGPRQIRGVTLSSKTIFVAIGARTFAEVDTETGKVKVAEVQPN